MSKSGVEGPGNYPPFQKLCFDQFLRFSQIWIEILQKKTISIHNVLFKINYCTYFKTFSIEFSPTSNVKVIATIDERDVFECRRASLGQPLFVAEWNPNNYDDGKIHSLRVDVRSSNNVMSNHSRTFQFGLGQKENFMGSGNLTGDFSFLSR